MDGTIVDPINRLYSVYFDICKELGLTILNKSDYIAHRKIGFSLFPDEVYPDFEDKVSDMLEEPARMKHDTIYPGMKETINILSFDFDVYILTYRNNKTIVKDQLNSFGINNVKVIAERPKSFDKFTVRNQKSDMILGAVSNPAGFIIGDTEYEICSGKKLGLKTISVPWGNRSIEYLQKFGPDHIISHVDEILGIIYDKGRKERI